MTKIDNTNGYSVIDLYNAILKNKLSIELKNKLSSIYYKIIGSTPR